jgi:5-methylcytosine-specific restriction endonuclease McrA
MDESSRQLVWDRAAHRCEHCHLPQTGHEERFSIDHVRPRKHGGDDSVENLALSCLRCNLFKGTDFRGERHMNYRCCAALSIPVEND